MIEFLFEAGMLKKTPRTGYQFLGTGGESVADHSFRMTVVGYVLASLEPEADGNKVVLMCLFHDLPEARTGDHNYVNKRYTEVDENAAMDDQVRGLPFGSEMKSLFLEFNEAQTLEAKLAKDADQIDLILDLKEQLDIGNSRAKDWLSFAVQRLVTDPGRRIAHKILESESDGWWFDKKDSDWWVNGNGMKD